MKYEARRVICEFQEVNEQLGAMAERGWSLVAALPIDGRRELYFQREAKAKPKMTALIPVDGMLPRQSVGIEAN